MLKRNPDSLSQCTDLPTHRGPQADPLLLPALESHSPLSSFAVADSWLGFLLPSMASDNDLFFVCACICVHECVPRRATPHVTRTGNSPVRPHLLPHLRQDVAAAVCTKLTDPRAFRASLRFFSPSPACCVSDEIADTFYHVSLWLSESELKSHACNGKCFNH